MITMPPLQGPTWHNSLNTFTFFHASELQLRCVIFCSGNFPRLRAPEPHSTMLLDFRSRPDSPKPLWKTGFVRSAPPQRSEEHTSELQSLMRISYAVFCLNTKNKINN